MPLKHKYHKWNLDRFTNGEFPQAPIAQAIDVLLYNSDEEPRVEYAMEGLFVWLDGLKVNDPRRPDLEDLYDDLLLAHCKNIKVCYHCRRHPYMK